MTETKDISAPFKEFAGKNGDYYAKIFLNVQQDKLQRTHINWSAALGSFFWAALRANWLLFWIVFLMDLVALVYVALTYKYATASAQAVIDEKDFLVERYDAWTSNSMIAAIVIFVLGRLVFGWLADRFYFRQYSKWRITPSTASDSNPNRLVVTALIVALIAPLMLYRASQFAPEERACIK